MKVIIAGSRTITHEPYVWEAIMRSEFEITELVCGESYGVDYIAKIWALRCDIPVKQFPAAWSTQGKKAGPMRNEQMAKYANALIAIWDGESKGTKSMIDLAREYGLKVYVYMTNKQPKNRREK